MKTRLKVLCWLFVATYMAVIVHTLVFDMIPEFASIFEVEAADQNQEESVSVDVKYSYPGRISVALRPMEGRKSYPDSFVNKKTGKELGAEVRLVYLDVRDSSNTPWYLLVGNLLNFPFALGIAFIIIYIPILSFKTVNSIVKNDIFDKKNIRRIRRIGYSLIAVFAFISYYAFIIKTTASHYVDLENYEIVSEFTGEDIFLLSLGIAILIFAEILNVATQIKEEQDLTV